MDSKQIESRPDNNEFSNANHYKVTLKMSGRRATFYYSMGSALNGLPKIDDVLMSLAMDSMSVPNTPTLKGFSEFCNEFGYENIKQAGEIYRDCVKNRRKMIKLMGERLLSKLSECEE